MKAEGNPMWNGGEVPTSWYGKNWRRQRARAKQRDKHTCQQCGITEKDYGRTLEVHHIKPFACFSNQKQANYLKNLVTLCHRCHSIAEQKAKARNLPRFQHLPLTFES
jgi:5-methylcytosine-specific restriction endonuclease McrA